MSFPSIFPRSIRTRLPLGLVCLAMAGTWLALPPEGHSQAPFPLNPRTLDAINGMIDQVKKQQAQMVDNQTKIETQTAALKEELRLVKIYSERVGGGRR